MSRRVAVVGAGVIGLSCAYHLAKEGHDVVVFERDGERRSSTSFGNAGLIVPSHFTPLAAPGVIRQAIRWMRDPASPFYLEPRLSPDLLAWGYHFWRAASLEKARRAAPLLVRLNLASLAAYRQLAAELPGGFGLEQRGLLLLSASEEAHQEEARLAEVGRSLGLEVDVLDGAGVQSLEPTIQVAVAGGVRYRADAHLDPGRLMSALQRQLHESGVEFRWGSEPTSLKIGAGKVKGLAGPGISEAVDSVVLAGGSWSSALAAGAGLRLLLQPGKGYSLTVERVEARPITPAILTEARVAVTPLGEGLRIGGTMEIAGFDRTLDERRVRGIIDAVSRYLPSLDLTGFESAERWQGLRPCSPDGLPYLGNVERCKGLTVATGHAMMGLSLAPITGRLVADLVAGRRPEIDLSALSPERHSRHSRRAVGGVGSSA